MIQDSGIGIRKEDLPRVFEKGYTGQNGRFQQRASGLGLYMSQQAAEKAFSLFYLKYIVNKQTNGGRKNGK